MTAAAIRIIEISTTAQLRGYPLYLVIDPERTPQAVEEVARITQCPVAVYKFPGKTGQTFVAVQGEGT